MSHLDELLDVLWPGHVRGSGAGERQFVVVPDAQRPRLLLPRRPWRVTAGALRNYSTSMAGWRLGVLRLAAAGVRLGGAEVWPRRLDLLPGEVPGIDAHLKAVLGRDLHVALYVGPPRAVQKPVLQLLDPAGHTFAFAKLSIDATTERLVRHEAEVLTRLSTARLAHVIVPRVLHHGVWRGHELLVQEAVSGDGRVPRDLLERAGTEVARLGAAETPALGKSLAVRLDALPASATVQLLRQTLSALPDDTCLERGASHGDWTWWNMAAAGRRLVVWDWEGFSDGVPIGFDALHHRLNSLVTRGAAPVPEAFAMLGEERERLVASLGGRQPALTLVLYTLHLATSYLENGEDRIAGTSLARLGSWLEPTLHAQLDMLGEDSLA